MCRKLSCSGHTCNSQEDSFNSAYTEDEEDEEEYYHLRKANRDCNNRIESHSCQTYEDHATQTEDEDSESEFPSGHHIHTGNFLHTYSRVPNM